jgi:hypothetical protein
MFTESKLQKDYAECILHLIETCNGLIKKHGYPDNDTRTVSLVNIRLASYSSLGIANLLVSWSKGDNTVRQAISQLLGLTQADTKSVQLMGNTLDKTSKLSLNLLGQFQIENCIVNISNALGVKSKSKGFYNKADALLTHLGFDPRRLDVLKTGAEIRNSLHSNGIHDGHKGASFHSNLKGVQYDFIDGQEVSCATTPHIAHALECSVEVLDEVYSTHKIKSYSSLIPDAYAMIKGLGKGREDKP